MVLHCLDIVCMRKSFTALIFLCDLNLLSLPSYMYVGLLRNLLLMTLICISACRARNESAWNAC